MQTLSNYHGRQVWEFDPEAGTDEERAHVERLRREFTENRFRKRESQDLLFRIQVITLQITKVQVLYLPSRSEALRKGGFGYNNTSHRS